jgi:DNA processing protein
MTVLPHTDSSSDFLPYYLALWRTPGIGPSTFFKLTDYFSHLPDIFQASASDLATLNVRSEIIAALRQPDWTGVERDLAWVAQSPNHHIVTWLDAVYPPLLREIPSPPPVLFIRGNKALLAMPQLAMVGSRHPTQAGSVLAEQFALALSEAGFTITSGLALGIDAASHQGALSGSGLTIGVMGTGPDRIYPARHQSLARALLEKGAIVSELPVGVGPQAAHFPRRNRLISGLSLGVLVVEAAVGSGSLITARYANEQGREVFAIPGSIHNPLARGCHKLIRQGAKLVETAGDILEEISGLLQWSVGSPRGDLNIPPLKKEVAKLASSGDFNQEPLSPEYSTLLNGIDFSPTPMDLVISRTGLTAGTVSSMLSILELQGYIGALPGGYARII